MSRCRFILIGAALVLSACSGADIAAPARSLTPTAADRGVVPGSNGDGSNSTGAHALACNIPSPLNGSAIIGPRGGILDVGTHRLIVPPGALISETTITGKVYTTSPNFNSINGSVVIEFEPTGLHFKKPAGLIFDASSCGSVPDVVYLNPVGTNELIPAVYSSWWHTIAAPIEHFSQYAINF